MTGKIDPLERALRAKSEKQWQSEVVEILQRFGWKVYHTFDSRRSEKGFPDIFAIHVKSGDVMAIELKRQIENPTPEQEEWGALFEHAQIDWYVWRPSDIDEVILRARGY